MEGEWGDRRGGDVVNENPSNAARSESIIRLVPRDEIPASATDGGDHGSIDYRAFHDHELLRHLVPFPGVVSFAWSRLASGEELPARPQPMPTLIIVVQGRAALTGAAPRPIAQGDVVTIPSGREFGFADVGPDGLAAIHVSFTDSPEDRAGETTTLEGLLARNRERGQAVLANPLYRMLVDGTLNDPVKRDLCRSCVQTFSDVFQTIIFTRQATCRDDDYRGTFLAHFLEELGHNEMIGPRRDGPETQDPILVATGSWFAAQMYALDNVEKAVIVNLVLETSGHLFHSMARRAFANDAAREYFAVHSDNDERHQEMAVGLLTGHHPDTYRRLHRLLDDGWDMFEAMARRMAQIVAARGARRP
jgi:hypothetical protein